MEEMMQTATTIDEILDEMFDTRQVVELVEYLEGVEEDDEEYQEAQDELARIRPLVSDLEDFADYLYGETIIRDDYFKTYAQELAEDIGAIDKNADWPLSYIDWDAASDALKMDYSAFEFEGVTYWGHS